MKLVCEKYKEEVAAARCRHPTEYCKFRPACLIHFRAKENGGRGAADGPGPQPGPAKEESGDDHTTL